MPDAKGVYILYLNSLFHYHCVVHHHNSDSVQIYSFMLSCLYIQSESDYSEEEDEGVEEPDDRRPRLYIGSGGVIK